MEGRNAGAATLDFEHAPAPAVGAQSYRRGLRLAPPVMKLHGPAKYRVLDLRRRRAQIRARHELGI